MARLGEVKVSLKNPDQRYLQISGLQDGQTVVLTNGDYINFQPFEDYQRGLVEIGKIDETTAQRRIEAAGKFVTSVATINRKNIVEVPAKVEGATRPSKATKSK